MVHRSEDIQSLKHRFLDRYNRAATSSRAIEAGILAASQHNVLYATPANPKARTEVRRHWGELLGQLAERYTTPRSAADYEADVSSLALEMNQRFADRFRVERHPKSGYDPGFRISHAQKSLGVALKHLWCLGEIETPPQCPVDRVVLRRAGLKYPDTRWAYVNTLDEHRRKIASLASAADRAGLDLAAWELSTFAA